MKKLLCFLLLLPISFVCMAQEVEVRVHEVQRGESIEYVAARYGVTVEELNSYNLFLDKYFYVGQKLNVPIKVKPKVESSYLENYSYNEKPKKKKRWTWGGWGRTSFNTYTPVMPMYGGFVPPSLNPGYAMMQAQQQMSLAQQLLQERWRIEQQSQQFFQNQNNAWQTMPAGGAWNTTPVMVETPAFVPSTTTGGGSATSSTGHQCRVCGGTGQVVDNTYLGNASLTKWCDICHAEKYVAHRHKKCQTCGGNGWISGY